VYSFVGPRCFFAHRFWIIS